jgi:hypothetical protein
MSNIPGRRITRNTGLKEKPNPGVNFINVFCTHFFERKLCFWQLFSSQKKHFRMKKMRTKNVDEIDNRNLKRKNNNRKWFCREFK